MSDDSYEGATAGRVLEFGSNESVKFPIIHTLWANNSYYCSIGEGDGSTAPGTRESRVNAFTVACAFQPVFVAAFRYFLKIFPLESDDVLFLSLEIGKLSNDFLTKLSQIFKRAGLVDLLFSTGVCLRGTRCFYECYFNPTQLSSDLNELETQLNVLDGVQRVLIEKVNV